MLHTQQNSAHYSKLPGRCIHSFVHIPSCLPMSITPPVWSAAQHCQPMWQWKANQPLTAGRHAVTACGPHQPSAFFNHFFNHFYHLSPKAHPGVEGTRAAPTHPSLHLSGAHCRQCGGASFSQGEQLSSITELLAKQLNTDEVDVQQRLQLLSLLMPDMEAKVPITRTDILLSLLQDLPGLAVQLMVLRDLLPGVNVSGLVSRCPALVINWSNTALAERLQVMRAQLPGVRVERLIDVEPAFLSVDLTAVLAHIQRLLPNEDPIQILLTQPELVLDMKAAGLQPGDDVEGPPPTYV